MQSFTSSSDIWRPSHNTSVDVRPSPVTTTTVVGGLVTYSLGENLKGCNAALFAHRVNAWQCVVWPCEQTGLRYLAPCCCYFCCCSCHYHCWYWVRAVDGWRGGVWDVWDKKCRYARTFWDIEKQLFEKLRHRLSPQDPHANRSECLE